MKYIIKVKTNSLDVYKKICEILGIDTQEELMKLSEEESTFTNEISITKKEEENKMIKYAEIYKLKIENEIRYVAKCMSLIETK